MCLGWNVKAYQQAGVKGAREVGGGQGLFIPSPQETGLESKPWCPKAEKST